MPMHDEDQPTPPNPLKGESKVARIPVKVTPRPNREPLPHWIRARSPSGPEVARIKALLREHQLHTVCEEAACPNLGECFRHGTATFMILGGICTRRCPFCDVAHGRPEPPAADEPRQLAETVQALGLRFAVITSVDRDDLRDGGAGQFAEVIRQLRRLTPSTGIEILVPDFRGREALAIDLLAAAPPDVFNHNLETVPRLYRAARPGADYAGSLRLLAAYKEQAPQVPTKSGLMVGLGERDDELVAVLTDLRAHGCDHVTIGQYLRPSPHHLPVERYLPPEQFAELATIARELGFSRVASGPLVRSSYHAEQQAAGEEVR